MRDRHGQVDVTHALAADDGTRHFHAAFLADDAAVADALVLAAETLEVLGRTEDALAEKPIRLGALGAVVDSLRLGNLAAGPADHVFRAGDAERDGVKGIGGAGGESHTRGTG